MQLNDTTSAGLAQVIEQTFNKSAAAEEPMMNKFISKFLISHPRGEFVGKQIERELGPIGGVDPLVFAARNKARGDVVSTYRNYLATRVRQGRLDGHFLDIPRKSIHEVLPGQDAYFTRRNALEDGAQRLLDRISLF